MGRKASTHGVLDVLAQFVGLLDTLPNSQLLGSELRNIMKLIIRKITKLVSLTLLTVSTYSIALFAEPLKIGVHFCFSILHPCSHRLALPLESHEK